MEKSMTRAEHIRQLADTHHITLDVRRSTRGMSYGDTRTIRISEVKGPVSYAVALHEIGHLVAEGASGRQFPRLMKEIRAWRWARAHAIEWTERMDWEMQRSMGCYLLRAKRHGWPIPEEIYRDVEAYV
jgi:hypothetical protein